MQNIQIEAYLILTFNKRIKGGWLLQNNDGIITILDWDSSWGAKPTEDQLPSVDQSQQIISQFELNQFNGKQMGIAFSKLKTFCNNELSIIINNPDDLQIKLADIYIVINNKDTALKTAFTNAGTTALKLTALANICDWLAKTRSFIFIYSQFIDFVNRDV